MDAFCCEGCGIPLTQEMLVDPEYDEDPTFLEEAAMSNAPGACPECGAVQWETW